MNLTMISRARPSLINVELLAQTHYDDVWRFCYRRVGRTLADDACQQTFIGAHKSASKFRGDSEPKTWLLGIANRVCIQLHRASSSLAFTDAENSHATHDPSHAIESKIVLQQALSKLNSEQQTIILMHEIEGYTQQEIALILNIPEGTVKSRLFYAIKALKQQLGVQQ